MKLKMIREIEHKCILPYVSDAHNIILFAFFSLIVSLEVCQLYTVDVLSVVYYLLFLTLLIALSVKSIIGKRLYIHIGYYVFMMCIEVALSVMFIAGILDGDAQQFMAHMVFVIFGNLILLILQCIQIKYCYSSNVRRKKERKFIIRPLILIILVFFIVTLLNYECANSWIRWDSYIYYNSVSKLKINNIFEAITGGNSGLIICKHITSAFAMYLLFIKSISGFNWANTIYFSNILLVVIDIILFYSIIRKLIPYKNVFFYFLSALICGVSPYVLGSVNFMNPEHFLLTGTLMLIYGSLHDNYVVCLLAIFCMCNTKETGVVMAALMVAASFMKSILSFYKNKISINFGYYVCAFFVGFFWLLKYQKVNWADYNSLSEREMWLLDGSPMNAFGFSWLHISDICKGEFLTNFSWIFVIVLCLAIVKTIILLLYNNKLFLRKILVVLYDYFELLAGYLAFQLTLFFFVTWHFFRYYTHLVAFLYIIGIALLDYLIENIKYKKIVENVVLSIIAVLLLVQSYYTIDPIMLRVFSTYDTGNGQIVAADMHMTNYNYPTFTEAVCYNRQVLYFDEALDKALLCISPDDNTVILASDEFNASKTVGSIDAVWGKGYRYIDDPKWEKFDMDKGYRYLEDFPEHKLEFGFISEETDVMADYVGQWERVFYLEMPWENLTNDYLKEKYNDSFILKDTAKYRGWVLNVYQFVGNES